MPINRYPALAKELVARKIDLNLAVGEATGQDIHEKFVTGGVAISLWYTYHGANRCWPVTNFSPVKQVNINDPWY